MRELLGTVSNKVFKLHNMDTLFSKLFEPGLKLIAVTTRVNKILKNTWFRQVTSEALSCLDSANLFLRCCCQVRGN